MVHIDDMSTESVEAWLKRRKEEEKQKEEQWEYLDLTDPSKGWRTYISRVESFQYTWELSRYFYAVSEGGALIWRKKQ